jgi:hypothetical protein
MNQRIIYQNEDGTVAVIMPANCGMTIEQIAKKDVPAGKEYKIVAESEVPSDRMFRDAWEYVDGKISVNLTKAKEISHVMRRSFRAAEFEPYDQSISKQIPGTSVADAEASREKIRTKYANIQLMIDQSTDVDGLKEAIGLCKI